MKDFVDFGRIRLRQLSPPESFEEIFNSSGFFVSRSRPQEEEEFFKHMNADVFRLGRFELTGKAIFQKTLQRIKKCPFDAKPSIQQYGPRPLIPYTKQTIRGGEEHRHLVFLTVAWLLDFDFYVRVEVPIAGFIDVITTNKEWFVECGDTNCCGVFDHFFRQCCQYFAIVPFQTWEHPLEIFIFTPKENFMGYAKEFYTQRVARIRAKLPGY